MTKLDKFGKLIAEGLRDGALNRYLDIESGWGATEALKNSSKELSEFSESQLTFIRGLLTDCVDVGIHEFLCSIEEQNEDLKIQIEGQNVTDLSDGLQGEIFTEDGWFERFSQHKEKGI